MFTVLNILFFVVSILWWRKIIPTAKFLLPEKFPPENFHVDHFHVDNFRSQHIRED